MFVCERERLRSKVLNGKKMLASMYMCVHACAFIHVNDFGVRVAVFYLDQCARELSCVSEL